MLTWGADRWQAARLAGGRQSHQGQSRLHGPVRHSHCCWSSLLGISDFLAGDTLTSFALQAHYPERLSMLWMYEAPTIFWGLWQVSLAAVSCINAYRRVQHVQYLNEALLTKS